MSINPVSEKISSEKAALSLAGLLLTGIVNGALMYAIGSWSLSTTCPLPFTAHTITFSGGDLFTIALSSTLIIGILVHVGINRYQRRREERERKVLSGENYDADWGTISENSSQEQKKPFPYGKVTATAAFALTVLTVGLSLAATGKGASHCIGPFTGNALLGIGAGTIMLLTITGLCIKKHRDKETYVEDDTDSEDEKDTNSFTPELRRPWRREHRSFA